MMKYAGIGSRSTWDDVCATMTTIASTLCEQGYTLRSGHARGADQAFEAGAFGQAEIFLPWPDYESTTPVLGRRFDQATDAAYKDAGKYHDGWFYLSRGSRALMARNMHQVLGWGLDDPVDFVVCWTPNGSKTGRERDTGGTGQAIRVAVAHNIKVFNLRNEDDMRMVREWLST